MATPVGPSIPFVMEEDIPSGGLRVELRDSDAPMGGVRAKAGFEKGGTLEKRAIYLPGRERPIFQIQQPRERPLMVSGHFRDHLWATARGAADVTHTRDMIRAIERIRRRANPLRISWGDERWFGILEETLFPVEGQHDSQYTLTFAVSHVDDSEPESPPPPSAAQAPADVAAAIQADIAAQSARMAALGARATALVTQATIVAAMDLAAAAAEDMVIAAAKLDLATGAGVIAEVNRVDGIGRTVQTDCAAARALLSATTTAQMAPDGDPGDTAAWQAAQYAALASLAKAEDDARTVRMAARARVRSSVRLYQVQPDDTLESIARGQLGDAARAGELGVRADQVRPGVVLRIPEAR